LTEPFPEEKLNAAIAHCMQSRRLAAYWRDAPAAARDYILLRFYAATFNDELSPEEYEARRAEAAAKLGPDEIKYLFQREKEIEEIKFLASLRAKVEKGDQEIIPHQVSGEQAEKEEIPLRQGSGERAEKKEKRKWEAHFPRLWILRIVGTAAVLAAAGVLCFFLRAPQEQQEEEVGQNQVQPLGGERGVILRQGHGEQAGNEADLEGKRVEEKSEPGHSLLAPNNPTTEPPNHQTTEPPNHPTTQPPNHPTTEPPNHPTTEPPNHQTTQPDYVDAGRTLQSLGGIKFGSVHQGTPIAKELLSEGSTLAECGMGFAVKGPVLKRRFLSFDAQPVLWISPKSFRVYRMDFAWQGKNGSEEAMAEVAGALESRFGVKMASSADGSRAFRMGETTVSLVNDGGTVKMRVEHAGFKESAKAEFGEVRRTMMEDFDATALFAGGYPNGGMVHGKTKKAGQNTPKAFGGIVFGSVPTPGTHVVVEARTGEKTFYLDYAVRAIQPFKRFTAGRAFFDAAHGVYAVELESAAGPDELTAGEYTENVRETLARRFPPPEGAAEKGLPATFHAGDVDIALLEDPQGGLVLRAVNKVLAPLAHGAVSTKEESR